ncbi:MAG: T9SS type A sorting domain-containing protein [Bacteroidia bacterium]
MKKYYFIYLMMLCFMSSYTYGQSLERTVIGANGGFIANSSYKLEYTTGEAIVSTLEVGTFILNQGFNQTNPPYNVGIDPVEIQIGYKLYPNPTTNFVTLELTMTEPTDIKIEILDVRGQNISVAPKVWGITNSLKEQFDLTSLPAGIYLMRISNPSGEVGKVLRIEKTH